VPRSLSCSLRATNLELGEQRGRVRRDDRAARLNRLQVWQLLEHRGILDELRKEMLHRRTHTLVWMSAYPPGGLAYGSTNLEENVEALTVLLLAAENLIGNVVAIALVAHYKSQSN